MFDTLNRRMLLKWMEATYDELLEVPIAMLGTIVGPAIGTAIGTIIGGKLGKAIGFKLDEWNNQISMRGPYGDGHRNRRLSARLSAALGVTAGSAIGASLGAAAGCALGELVGDALDELLWKACMWFINVVTEIHKKDVLETDGISSTHLVFT